MKIKPEFTPNKLKVALAHAFHILLGLTALQKNLKTDLLNNKTVIDRSNAKMRTVKKIVTLSKYKRIPLTENQENER